jgi:hypothetical protein
MQISEWRLAELRGKTSGQCSKSRHGTLSPDQTCRVVILTSQPEIILFSGNTSIGARYLRKRHHVPPSGLRSEPEKVTYTKTARNFPIALLLVTTCSS